jgi:hypothetical protein
MKLFVSLSAACSCLILHSSGALAADMSAEASTASVDPSVSGMLPSENNEGKPAAAPGTDKKVGRTSEATEHDRDAKNALYLDLLGPGLVYSINYDRVIADDFSARIGFSYLSYSMGASNGAGTTAGLKFSYFAIPVTVSYLGIGSANNMLELGAGGELLNAKGDGFINASEGSASASASRTFFALTGLAGYRHQPADGGFVFRVGLSPVEIFGLNKILPTGYLSLGAAF